MWLSGGIGRGLPDICSLLPPMGQCADLADALITWTEYVKAIVLCAFLCVFFYFFVLFYFISFTLKCFALAVAVPN